MSVYYVTMSLHVNTMCTCEYIFISIHKVTILQSNYVTMSQCHKVIMSQCHYVTTHPTTRPTTVSKSVDSLFSASSTCTLLVTSLGNISISVLQASFLIRL